MLKKWNKAITLLILCACLCLLGWFCYSCLMPSVRISSKNVVISKQISNPFNVQQRRTSVVMTAYQDRLYFDCVRYYSNLKSTKYKNKLSVFEDGSVHVITQIPKDQSQSTLKVYGAEGYLYYWVSRPKDGTKDLFRSYPVQLLFFSLSTGKENLLLENATEEQLQRAFFSESGVLYVPVSGSQTEKNCYAIEHGKIQGVVEGKNSYELGDAEYSVESVDGVEEVICQAEGSKTVVPLSNGQDGRNIVPCNEGLLIHNEGGQHPLYLLTRDGELVDLLEIPCMMSVSSLNYYKGFAYLSVERFEKYGENGLEHYENDAIQGTYRIDLTNYCSKRISDAVYVGMYIFDDSGIFACDKDGSIFQVGFDGTVLDVLLLNQ